MKKTYIKPELNIQVIQLTGMLATSGPDLKDSVANDSYGMDAKSFGNWDIWGSGDDDYYDDY